MYRLPPLTGLRAFEAAARHLSFKDAARELNVTPAALSFQIRSLEDTLGVALFQRRNRAVDLTDAGARIFPGIRDGFERMDLAMRRLDPARAERALVVSTGPAFAAKWLAPHLVRFMEAYPDIPIRISATLGMADFARDGVDLSVRFGHGRYPGTHTERFLDEYVLPLASPRLLETGPPLTSPADLRHHTLIQDDSSSFAPNAPGWPEWLTIAGVGDIDGTRGPRFNHADHALDAAAEGMGVVLGRWSLSHADRHSGRLIAPFDLVLPLDLAFYLVCPAGTENTPRVAAFRDWIVAESADLRASVDDLKRRSGAP